MAFECKKSFIVAFSDFKMSVERSIFDWTLLGIESLAILIQLYVIWLVAYKSPKAMKRYKIYLFAQTVNSNKRHLKF